MAKFIYNIIKLCYIEYNQNPVNKLQQLIINCLTYIKIIDFYKMNKLLLIAVSLIVLMNSQLIKIAPVIPAIKTIDTTPPPQTNSTISAISAINLNIRNFTTILSRTQTAFIYHGTVDIQITQGQQNTLDFFVQFVPETQCNWTKCFTGWVLNYTQLGQDPVLGYPDGKLDVPPIFSFNTNSQEDFQIIRSYQLSQIWAQIIEISCQKLNPQLIQNSSLNTRSFFIINPNSANTTTNTTPPKYIFQDAAVNLQLKTLSFTTSRLSSSSFESFSSNSNFKLLTAQKGDLLATLSNPVNLEGFDVKNSAFNQQILLSQDLTVKQRLINYDFSLKSDNGNTDQGGATPDFAGRILIGLNLAQNTTVLTNTVSKVKSSLSLLTPEDNSFNFQGIETRRLNFGYSFNPQQPVLPTEPDIQQKFQNEVYSGIDVAKYFNGEVSSSTISSLATNQLQTPLSSIGGARLLQLLAVYTIYNYNKVLFSKTIFGKLFQVSVQVDCYLLIYPSVHNIQCTGIMKYDLFSKSKQITIFNFVKSVSYAWSYSTSFSGNWGFSIYIPLPPPVSFLGINFAFNIGYSISLSVSSKNNGGYPYKIVVGAVASTALTTDASAAVRAVVIQGGVFISGNLVKLTTDPTVTLSYYWLYVKKINILAQWYLYINAFQYDWGFFYRYWTFWSGWSGRKIIAKWTINGLYAKYTLVNKSWNIYY